MKSLFTILSIVLISGVFALPPASAVERGDSGQAQWLVAAPEVNQVPNPVIVATSWQASGSYGYYGRWDHRHRNDHHYFGRRHGHGRPHFYGQGRFYSPYRPFPYYGKGYYHRPHRGAYFGFSACYRSGSVHICISEPYPYHYRHW
jgi:hypothetical protein